MKYSKWLYLIGLVGVVLILTGGLYYGYKWVYSRGYSEGYYTGYESGLTLGKVWPDDKPVPTPSPGQVIKPDTPAPVEVPDGSATVYITNTGAKYHRAGCRSLSKSSIPISKEDAIARGYAPCGICKP